MSNNKFEAWLINKHGKLAKAFTEDEVENFAARAKAWYRDKKHYGKYVLNSIGHNRSEIFAPRDASRILPLHAEQEQVKQCLKNLASGETLDHHAVFSLLFHN